MANFYVLKGKKISAGRVALDDWLGRYRLSTRVGIFAEFGVRRPAGDDQGRFWQWLQRGSDIFGGDLDSSPSYKSSQTQQVTGRTCREPDSREAMMVP